MHDHELKDGDEDNLIAPLLYVVVYSFLSYQQKYQFMSTLAKRLSLFPSFGYF